MPKFLLFDIGSTLMEGLNAPPAKYLAKLLGLPSEVEPKLKHLLMTTEAYSTVALVRPLIDIINSNPNYPYQFPTAALEKVWTNQLFLSKPILNAIETVEAAKKAGYTVAFVSDNWRPFVEAFDLFFGDRDASLDFFSYKLGFVKSKCYYDVVLNKLQAKSEDCLMIGDSLDSDIQAANDAGIKAIWIPRAGTSLDKQSVMAHMANMASDGLLYDNDEFNNFVQSSRMHCRLNSLYQLLTCLDS